MAEGRKTKKGAATMSGQTTAGMLSIQETIPPEEAEAIRVITQSAEAKLRIAALLAETYCEGLLKCGQTAPHSPPSHVEGRGESRGEGSPAVVDCPAPRPHMQSRRP